MGPLMHAFAVAAIPKWHTLCGLDHISMLPYSLVGKELEMEADVDGLISLESFSLWNINDHLPLFL